MEFINIGPACITGWLGGVCGWMGVRKALTKKQDDAIVEFRVAMMCTYTHNEPIFHYKA